MDPPQSLSPVSEPAPRSEAYAPVPERTDHVPTVSQVWKSRVTRSRTSNVPSSHVNCLSMRSWACRPFCPPTNWTEAFETSPAAQTSPPVETNGSWKPSTWVTTVSVTGDGVVAETPVASANVATRPTSSPPILDRFMRSTFLSRLELIDH